MAVTPERKTESLLNRPVADEADQLRALVSALLSGSYKEDIYLRDVAPLCRSNPPFARQLLSLIDRYQRLGQLPAAQHRKIREKIVQSLATQASARHGVSAEQKAPASTVTAEVPVAAAPSAVPAPPRPSLPRESPAATVTAPLPAAPEPVAPAARGPTVRKAQPPASATTVDPGVPGDRVASIAELPSTLAPAQAQALAQARAVAGSVIGPGTVLRQRYELQGLLGYGGMASVFKAVDRYRARLRLEDCCVALKVIAPYPPNPSHVAALGREFHNAQQLSHPNIINVYELDHEGDASFYTMELLEGEQLNQLLERIGGAPPQPQALAIIRDIGNAIAHAHSRGVVHADLKPQNIFVTYGGQVRVLDFGGSSLSIPRPPPGREPWIAEMSPEQSADTYRTATPAYASCEQLEGHKAGPQDDVFALGCIAYELLTGHHPFDGKSATQARAQQLRARRPPMLRGAAWRALRSALAWQRERRPDTLDSWLRQLGIAAAAERLPPSHQLLADTPPRVWLPRIAAAAALLIMAGTVGLVLRQRGNLDWHQTLLSAQDSLQAAQQELRNGLSGPPAAAPGPSPLSLPGRPTPATPAAHATGGGGPSSAGSALPGEQVAADRFLPSAEHARPGRTRHTNLPDAGDVARVAGISGATGAADATGAAGVAFTSSSYAVAGSAPAARLIVHRTGNFQGEVRFVWWTQEDSAKADVDYAPLGRRLEHIPRGADTVAIYVPIISNPLRHRTESFYVTLGTLGDVDPGMPTSRATVTIERGG